MGRSRPVKLKFPRGVYQRLGEALDASPLERQEIARRMGVHPSRLSEWTSGRRNPSGIAIRDLCRLTRTNAHWLLFGTGPRDWP